MITIQNYFTNKNQLLFISQEKISTQRKMHFGVHIATFCRNY